MTTSGSLGRNCLRREESEEKQPRQLRQYEPPTYGAVGTRAATRNSTPSGTSGASTSAGPTGTTNSSDHRHPRQHRPPRPRSRESCSPQNDSDSDDDEDNDDDDDDDDEDDIDLDINNKVLEILAKEARRLALKRASRARYRARYPERVAEQRRQYVAKNRDRVAEQRRQYRTKNRDRIAEQRRQYRAKNRDRVAEQRRQYHTKNRNRIAEQRQRYRKRYAAQRAEFMRRYYATQAERIREHKRQFYRSEAGQRWQKQYLAKKRESSALLRQQRGPMVQKRTEEKRQALGPLKLTVTLEDFMEDFCNTLSPSPEDSMDQPETITDMDSGVFHPMDPSVCDESSLSSCDMWDDGKGFLDNLLDDLPSSSDDSLLDNLLEELDDLSSSDDCPFDFLTDMMLQEDPSFDLDDFVT